MTLKIICNWLGGLALALISGTVPQAAKAYQVDCAILLCIAGGWPASAECAGSVPARGVICSPAGC
jgi:formate/nitrite transporter FocA (FNT family)